MHALHEVPLNSQKGSERSEEDEMEKRDNVAQDIGKNFFKEFQHVRDSMRRSNQGLYGSSIFFDKGEHYRKRSQSLGRRNTSGSPCQPIEAKQ